MYLTSLYKLISWMMLDINRLLPALSAASSLDTEVSRAAGTMEFTLLVSLAGYRLFQDDNGRRTFNRTEIF
jgi:hypothetical protein